MKSVLFLILSFLLVSCGEQKTVLEQANFSAQADQVLYEMATTYLFPLPKNAFEGEEPNEAIVKLGKELYNEKNLSKDKKVSCNTCHPLDDYGVNHVSFSEGVEGQRGDRNAPTTFNAALHLAQFWDGRAKNVEAQVAGPLLNPKEMGMESKKGVEKAISVLPKYQVLFAQAYGDANINYDRIAKAIGAFERTLLTPSRLDTYLQGDLTALDYQEKKGLKIMLDIGCIPCHSGPAMGGALYQKFGIFGDYRTFTGSNAGDYGIFLVTKSESKRDVFKVPSLRNVTKTAPYFHDGSVEDLEEAIQIMGKLQLGHAIAVEEVKDIISFLKVSSDWQ